MADASVKIRGGAGNAVQIQSRAIDAVAPTDGQALAWSNSDSEWEPTTISAGSSEWTDTGTVLHPADSSGTLDNVVIGGTSLANSDIALGVDGSAVFNEQSSDVDFRVESNGNENMLFVDGGEDRVGVGTGTPTEFFEVEGSTPFLSIRNTAETEAGIIFSDSAAPIAQFARLLLDSGSAESGLTAGFSIMTAGGTLTGTINATASTTVTGVGTAFLTELVVGDRLILRADGTSDALAEIRTITAIASNTSLTVATAFTDLGIDTTPAFEVRAMQFKSNGSIGMGINPTVGAEKVVLDGAMALKEQSAAPSATADYAKIAAVEDGLDSNTVLMLHCDGADSGTTFTDSSDSAHTVTATGNAHTDTTVKKFGTASGQFDGTGDYLSLADSADWNFGAGDFTIEFYLRHASLTGNQGYMGQEKGGSAEQGWYFYKHNGGVVDDGFIFRWRNTDGDRVGYEWSETEMDIVAGAWYHVALVRYGTRLTLYLDGQEQQIRVTEVAIGETTLNDCDGVLTLGRDSNDADLNGYLDEIRFSKGVARYTQNFAPPGSAFPLTRIYAINSAGDKTLLG
jgi:hypothetical protein